MPILVKSQVVLEFGSKIAATERLTVARQKDFSSDGCDFGGQRLRNVGLIARRNAQVKFTLYERLKTDLTKTRTLGNVSVPLSDVPVLEPHKGRGVLAKHREPSPQRYDLTYRRIIDGSEIKNGTVYLSVWMSPLLSVSDFARYFAKALRWGFWAAFVGLTAGLAYAFRGGLFEACLFVSPLPILLLLMEAPQWLGAFLTGQDKRAKFPTSKAPISVVFHSFRLISGRAIISRNGPEAWVLFSKRARAEHAR